MKPNIQTYKQTFKHTTKTYKLTTKHPYTQTYKPTSEHTYEQTHKHTTHAHRRNTHSSGLYIFGDGLADRVTLEIVLFRAKG